MAPRDIRHKDAVRCARESGGTGRYREEGINYDRTESPRCRLSSFRAQSVLATVPTCRRVTPRTPTEDAHRQGHVRLEDTGHSVQGIEPYMMQLDHKEQLRQQLPSGTL
ncbi:hypothetical protein NDU88_009175 [Pleurodeles waltl]|uniref:Uncharacterized protein n=1 Tax=Pleurodeles waltl TaxID=8319 RepID=A0AAV7NYH6_PLEWA|nr:hypothetical protein NDU88_009175 [Pleurodeles waltl]